MTREILGALDSGTYVTVPPRELDELLAESELVSEVDTHINNTIRLLRMGGRLVLQETSFEGEIFLRPMHSKEAADEFIRKRLDTYDRMWDGCGCKINFHE